MERGLPGSDGYIVSAQRACTVALRKSDGRGRQSLPSLAGIDVEPEQNVDFHGVVATERGDELPGGQSGDHFVGGRSRIGFNLMKVTQHSGAVELAANDDAGMIERHRQVRE